ncbi:hypothetical protein HU200_029316 [Digitaria exilis]|uniref:VWFA domain-containing protein n=1 Tax=Digitaria exilis TaxID=1010633 RepID=A0A835BQR3_9POAL|nr:hypothetical protein HU200_029316 [Digitaria exilis]
MGVRGALACLVFTLLLSLPEVNYRLSLHDTMLANARMNDAEPVKLTTTPIFPQIPRSQTSKDFQVLVTVEAPPPAGQKGRVPIDLAVVVNVGGGSKARLDSVKKAVRFIIWQLYDDDRLAVIGPSNTRLFGETATGFLDIRGGRGNAESSLEKLQPRTRDGQAQQTSGLKVAMKMLSELAASTSTRASFIILLTDTGESGSFSKVAGDLPVVHTIGLGAWHDPKALRSIAKESHGTYSFVFDDENADDAIAGAVAVCVSGVKAVAAVGTRLRLEAAAGSGVKIERVESGGYNYKSTAAIDKTSGEITVGVLYSGEAKSFIVHLHVPAVPPTTSPSVFEGNCDKQHLLTASFVVLTDEGDASPSTSILSVQRPVPDYNAVTAALLKVPVPVVMDHIAQFGVLELVTIFVEEEIWGLSSLTSITAEMAAAMATKLQTMWEEFVLARQFWTGLNLATFEVEINYMVSHLVAAGSGGGSPVFVTAYIFSWQSSYQMQRPTAMGSPSSVAQTFVTLNVLLTVQQITTFVTVAPGGCGDCLPCKDDCVEAQLPPVFVPSGGHGDTYDVNPAYPAELLGVMIRASNVKQCDSSGVVEKQSLPRGLA